MRVANKFEDPSGSLPTYEWEINHNEEDEVDKSRAIDHTANTAGTGLVRQQGAETPLTFTFNGTALTRAQIVTMMKWWNACRTRTIRFTDFAGDEYEVLITSIKPKRVRAAQNLRGGTSAPLWYWTYSITMEVITILSGVMLDAGVSP